MPKPKIDLKQLDRMIREGRTPHECAQHFGVTASGICRARKLLKNTVVRTAVMEKAHEIIETHLDVLGELKKINTAINEELDRAKLAVEDAKGRDRVVIQELIAKLTGEIRRQLELQLRIMELWLAAKETAEFREEVLSILDEMKPGARNEVIRRLKERRALRGLVELRPGTV